MAEQQLNIKIKATSRDLASGLSDAAKHVDQFSGKVKSLNVNITDGSMTSSVAFGNLWAGALTKVARELTNLGQQFFRVGASAINTGIQMNALFQTSQTGIAALVNNFNEVRGATDQWGASMQIAKSMQDQLRIGAMQTAAEYKDLLFTMQVASGPGFAAGLKPSEISQFVIRTSQVAGVIGLPGDQLEQEVRSLFQGQVDRMSRIAQLIFSGDADPKKLVEGWKEAGIFAEKMEERMLSFRLAAEAAMKTYAVSVSNLKDAFGQLMGEGTKGLTETLAAAMRMITKTVVHVEGVGDTAHLVFNKELIDTITTVANAIGTVVSTVTLATIGLIQWMKDLREWAGIAKDTVSGISGTAQASADAITAPTKAMARWTRKGLETLGLIDPKPAAYNSGGGVGADASDLAAKRQAEADKKLQELLANLIAKPRADLDAEAKAKKLADEILKQQQLALSIYGQSEDTASRLLVIERQRAEQVERIRAAMHLSPEERAELERITETVSRRNTSGVLIDAITRGSVMTAQTIGGSTSQIEGLHADSDYLVGRIIEGFRIGATEIEKSERWKKVAEELTKWQRNGAIEAGDIIADGLITGGRNVSEIFVAAFQKMTVEGSDSLVEKLTELFVGGKITYDAEGRPLINGQAPTAGQAGRINQLNTGMDFLNIGLGAYYGPQASGQDTPILGGALQGAMSGMNSAAGIYGAIIGAIVGAIGTALGNQAVYDSYKYGIPYVDPKGSYGAITDAENLRPTQIDEMIDSMLDKADEFWNGYAQIFIDAMSADLLAAVDTSQIGGAFQREGSKFFLKHFDEWLNGTLPDEIAERFRGGMESIYTTLGMSTDKFNELWEYWDSRDPAQAMKFWQGLLSAMMKMDETMDFFGGNGMVSPGELPIFATYTTTSQANMGAVRQEMGKSFAEVVRDSDVEIMNLANSLEHLTGDAQIRAAQQLAGLMEERMQREKQYYAQIIQMLDATDKAFDAMRRNLTLEGMVNEDGTPDQGGQLEYLKEYLDRIKANIESAASPEEIQYWQNEFFNTINQMLGLAGAMGPEQQAAIREWLMGEDGFGGVLSIMQDTIKGRLQELADSLGDANDDLIDALKPIWDTFLGALEDAGDVIGGGGGGGRGGDGTGGRGFVPDVENAAVAAATFGEQLGSVTELLVGFGEALASVSSGGGDYETTVQTRRRGGRVA